MFVNAAAASALVNTSCTRRSCRTVTVLSEIAMRGYLSVERAEEGRKTDNECEVGDGERDRWNREGEAEAERGEVAEAHGEIQTEVDGVGTPPTDVKARFAGSAAIPSLM